MRLVGFDSIFIFLSTGSPSQYFMPSHNRRLALFSCVTFSTSARTLGRCCGDAPVAASVDDGGSSFAGGDGPPRLTVERKPCFCRWSDKERCSLDSGTDVSPKRASDAFCKCEQTCERLTRDMLMESKWSLEAPRYGWRLVDSEHAS